MMVVRANPRPRCRSLLAIGEAACRRAIESACARYRDMEAFRVLEHTADIGFEAFGSTREEVFANAARALQDLMVDLASVAPREEIEIRVEGADPASLLVNWLSEILYRIDADGRLFNKFELRSLGDQSLTAIARGEPFNRARHQVKLQVKAITYHQLELETTSDGWRAQVYVDI